MKHLGTLAGAAVIAGGLAAGATAYASADGAAAGPAGAVAPADDTLPGMPFVDGPRTLGQALYGETVTKDDDGTIETHVWQNGQVTSASGSSVTVRSANGTSWTWTLTGDTKLHKDGKALAAADLAEGDNVRVWGTRDGGTRTAATVTDAAQLADLRKRMRHLRENLPRLRD
jgi:hypothetical protein